MRPLFIVPIALGLAATLTAADAPRGTGAEAGSGAGNAPGSGATTTPQPTTPPPGGQTQPTPDPQQPTAGQPLAPGDVIHGGAPGARPITPGEVIHGGAPGARPLTPGEVIHGGNPQQPGETANGGAGNGTPGNPANAGGSAGAFQEGLVRDASSVRTLNTIDPLTGRNVTGSQWTYGILADRVPKTLDRNGVVQEPVYISFASEQSYRAFLATDAEGRRRYIEAARANRTMVAPPLAR